MRKINLIPLFIACILSACLSPSEGDGSPDEPPTVTPTSSPTTVFTATPSQTLTPEPTPTPDPAQIAAEDFADYHLDPNDYKFAYDSAGHYQGWDRSGKIIYQDGRWSPDMAEKLAESSGSCMSTEFKSLGGDYVAKAQQEGFYDFIVSMIKQAFDTEVIQPVNNYDGENAHVSFRSLKIPGSTNCWGVLIGPKYQENFSDFIWQLDDGTVRAIPVF